MEKLNFILFDHLRNNISIYESVNSMEIWPKKKTRILRKDRKQKNKMTIKRWPQDSFNFLSTFHTFLSDVHICAWFLLHAIHIYVNMCVDICMLQCMHVRRLFFAVSIIQIDEWLWALFWQPDVQWSSIKVVSVYNITIAHIRVIFYKPYNIDICGGMQLQLVQSQAIYSNTL